MTQAGDPADLVRSMAFFGIDFVPEVQWELTDLSPSQLAELDEYHLVMRARVAAERPGDSWWTEARVYSGGLWDMGVKCDHPKEYRSGWPSDADLEQMCDGIDGALFYEKAIRQAWECGACGLMTMIPSRDDIDVAVLSGGPRAGERFVIPKDIPTWEVPVPLEPSFGPLSENISPVATMQTVIYQRTGRHVSFGVEFAIR